MIRSGKANAVRPYILGVSGGSGSGKTFFARALCDALGASKCELIFQDNFYFDQSKKFDFDGGAINFDHPDSIDFDLLAASLDQLKRGLPVEIPIYDFATHTRKAETLQIRPKPSIIVDGILIFHIPAVRRHFDDMIFFDTPEDLRFQRRLERDTKERGRTAEGVHTQFQSQVKPMHNQFVEPSKVHAHTVVREIGEFKPILESYCKRLRK